MKVDRSTGRPFRLRYALHVVDVRMREHDSHDADALRLRRGEHLAHRGSGIDEDTLVRAGTAHQIAILSECTAREAAHDGLHGFAHLSPDEKGGRKAALVIACPLTSIRIRLAGLRQPRGLPLRPWVLA